MGATVAVKRIPKIKVRSLVALRNLTNEVNAMRAERIEVGRALAGTLPESVLHTMLSQERAQFKLMTTLAESSRKLRMHALRLEAFEPLLATARRLLHAAPCIAARRTTHHAPLSARFRPGHP